MSLRSAYIICDQCGSQVPDLALQPGQSLRCGLCKTVVKRQRQRESFQPACAVGFAGMLFLALANIYPIMNFSVAGNTQANEIVTGVVGVEMQGISALWQGGIAFDAIGSPGPVSAETEAFELHVSELAAAASSDPIRIFFADGQGLLAGKTELKYLGIPVGLVEQVRSISGRVEATARFLPGYEFLTRQGFGFAIIRPELSLQGVKGIETLVGGIYIACAPGNGSEHAESFDAMPAAMPALLNDSGIEIVLEAPSTKVNAGAPISYNQTDVGEVVGKTLSQDGKQILLTARIREEYRRLLRSNSVFWADNTIEGKIWFFKIELDRPAGGFLSLKKHARMMRTLLG